MNKKINFGSLFICLFISGIQSQNLIPFDWELALGQHTDTEKTIPVNLFFSWERQGISAATPPGILQNTFTVPKSKATSTFTLEVTLLCKVKRIRINGHYIGGNFSTEFIWSPAPSYPSRKFSIPNAYLNFGAQNTIAIKCSAYSYTGGHSHNSVILYDESPATSDIQIAFEPGDHRFEDSRDVRFQLITDSGSKAAVRLMIQNDYRDTIVSREVDVQKGKQSRTISLDSARLHPGFYSVSAVLDDGGYTGTTRFFTLSPTAIKPSPPSPSSHTEFWNTALRELQTVPPKFTLEKKEHLSNSKRDGYIVGMQSLGGKTIYGYYFRPKREGRYAAILNVPGYGYGFEHLEEFLEVDDDVIELALCVRGHGLSKDALPVAFPVPGVFGYEICTPDKTAYRQIYMDCIRAIEFLLAREEVDVSRIGVTGSSQGGGLALMTAGLASDHIRAVAYGDPFPTDLTNHIKIRIIIKGELKEFLQYYDQACRFEDALQTLDLLDTRHFASQIRAETLYVTGLADDDCPPRLGFTAYNQIHAPKQFRIFPDDSHIAESGWKKEIMQFFKKVLKF